MKQADCNGQAFLQHLENTDKSLLLKVDENNNFVEALRYMGSGIFPDDENQTVNKRGG